MKHVFPSQKKLQNNAFNTNNVYKLDQNKHDLFNMPSIIKYITSTKPKVFWQFIKTLFFLFSDLLSIDSFIG